MTKCAKRLESKKRGAVKIYSARSTEGGGRVCGQGMGGGRGLFSFNYCIVMI